MTAVKEKAASSSRDLSFRHTRSRSSAGSDPLDKHDRVFSHHEAHFGWVFEALGRCGPGLALGHLGPELNADHGPQAGLEIGTRPPTVARKRRHSRQARQCRLRDAG